MVEAEGYRYPVVEKHGSDRILAYIQDKSDQSIYWTYGWPDGLGGWEFESLGGGGGWECEPDRFESRLSEWE